MPIIPLPPQGSRNVQSSEPVQSTQKKFSRVHPKGDATTGKTQAFMKTASFPSPIPPRKAYNWAAHQPAVQSKGTKIEKLVVKRRETK